MFNLKQKLMKACKFLGNRYFAVSLLAVACAVSVVTVFYNTRTVTINEDGQTKTIRTMRKELDDILVQANVSVSDKDLVEFKNHSANESEINISRAFTVTVKADGQAQQLDLVGGKVQDALAYCGVELNGEDQVSVSEAADLRSGMEIVVDRIEYKNVQQTDTIPHETTRKSTTLLQRGKTKVMTSGSDGEKTTTFRQKLVNGEVVKTEVVSEVISRQPVTEELLVGSSVMDAVSQIDPGNIEFNSKGVPANATKVLSGSATAYSGPGNWTASGRRAKVGHVAVNPNKIPYGTKMWIQSSDGKFIYGMAIASDTGGALMNGSALVDLYFESYDECCIFGRKNVDIYIIK